MPEGGSSEQGLLSEDSSLQPDARTENLRAVGCVSRRVAGREALYGQACPRGVRANKVFFPRTQACSLMLGRKICGAVGCVSRRVAGRTGGSVWTGMPEGGSSEQGLLSEDSSLQPDARTENLRSGGVRFEKGCRTDGRLCMDRHAGGGFERTRSSFRGLKLAA